MGKNLAGHKCHGHRGGRGKEPFWGRAQDHFGSREVLVGLLAPETLLGFRAKASQSLHSWSSHGALSPSGLSTHGERLSVPGC